MATKKMLRDAKEFEKKMTDAESGIRKSRAKIMKREGYKSEKEYFSNTNPFVNSDSKHVRRRAIRKSLNKYK